MDKYKLKWRIFAFLISFCALLLVILWLFQTVFLAEMYKYIRKVEIEQAIALVEKNIDSPSLQSVFAELETDKEILIMPTKEFAPPERSRQPVRGRRPIETITETQEFMLKDGHTISLTFFAIITPVDATVSTLQMQLYAVTAFMILFAVFFAAIIARRISKPIEEINKSAKILASGRYDTYFAGHGFLEIKELSDTLNTTAIELSKTDHFRRELMANISHDLRTPLALIYSYAEMMHDFLGEVTTEQTQMIMDEAKRLTSLVNDVLDVSRLETGVMELHADVYNITGSTGEIISRVAEMVKKDGYVLSFEHDKDVYVHADEVKITQAFYNLLINAIHYSAEDKTIIVRQSLSDGFVKIEIEDSGEGIAKEDLPYIWDRYYKIDKKHKRAITGTGLGLSIVKKIIELHHGECGVDSHIGAGSIFWFRVKAL